ncbi:hypothetical protein [Nitrososphaeria virus YSH_174770]|uniref:Uncharacterized protein n=1 Tax=Nitrososphaeria virus YSH_174770 TaxID=3071322 RepID=A0A976YF41_9CAUD|nr:hypothetical protein QKV93_gp51 [Yangshan Harbor Nitrososphaeria virus]UVF62396.1 hypothetical protein [Nitrososphaeria virus YSH_174770]
MFQNSSLERKNCKLIYAQKQAYRSRVFFSHCIDYIVKHEIIIMATITDLIDYVILLRQEIAKRDEIIAELRRNIKTKNTK